MKRIRSGALAVGVILLAGHTAFADAPSFGLIPEPQKVRSGSGTFAAASPRILIESGPGQRDDRLAATTLAEELATLGKKALVNTTAARARPAAGAIYLARLPRRGGLRATLEARGFALGQKLDEEGYVIDIEPSGIVVAAESSAGIFYGVQTLRQLLDADAKGQIVSAAVQIEDHPAMRWRGIHDDVSRGPVPTLEYMKQQIRTISEYKLNLYALYMEGVFDYRNQPLIAPKEGALTAAELKELIAYAARYHVTVLPEQQTFGHLHQMLRYEEYSDVAERPNGHVLTPRNPRTYEIIKSLYAELIPLFPGPFAHIGGDETAELGSGQTRELVQKQGLGKVYLEHLQRVAEIMKPYGKRLMFWTDIAVNYPESLPMLPKDMVAVAWDYAARSSYDAQLKPFKDAGMALFVSPSVHNYRTAWPDFEVAFVNIRNFVRDGQRYNALGMLNTSWDDEGEELFEMTWPAVVFGAACSWQAGESSIERFQSSYDWAFYRSKGTTFRDALADLARIHALHRTAGVGTVDVADVWRDVFSPEGANYVKHVLPIARDMRLLAEHALTGLYQGRHVARAHTDTIDAILFAALVFDAQGLRVQYANDIAELYGDAYLNQKDRPRMMRDLYQISSVDGRLQDLRDLTSRLRAMYSALWLYENRPYLLHNVLAQYDTRLVQITTRINALAAMKDSVMYKGVPLPTPAQLGFFKTPADKASDAKAAAAKTAASR
jgi:hypothetical protein